MNSMNIEKHKFTDTELEKFKSDFHKLDISTEPILNLIAACIHQGNIPIVEYYKKEYLSNEIYYSYLSASSIVNPAFLHHTFGKEHFIFLARLEHKNYVLNYGSSQFLVSATSKELISSHINMDNIHKYPEVIKDIVGFSLKMTQLLTLYGVGEHVQKNLKQFFLRMTQNLDIKNVLTADYDKELEPFQSYLPVMQPSELVVPIQTSSQS